MFDEFRETFGRASSVVPQVNEVFEKACLYALVVAYKKMTITNSYDLSWEETQFSAHLIKYMREVRRVEDIALRIDPECYLYRPESVGWNRKP